MGERNTIIAGILFLAGVMALIVYFGFFSDIRPLEKARWEKHDAQIDELRGQLKELSTQIQNAQGQSRCEEDRQCRVVGLGSKICGEYRDYLIYSVVDANGPSLSVLIPQFNALHQKLNGLTLSANNCGIKPAPIRCIAGKCVPDRR